MNRAAVVCGRRLDYPAPDRAEPRYPVARCVGVPARGKVAVAGPALLLLVAGCVCLVLAGRPA